MTVMLHEVILEFNTKSQEIGHIEVLQLPVENPVIQNMIEEGNAEGLTGETVVLNVKVADDTERPIQRVKKKEGRADSVTGDQRVGIEIIPLFHVVM